AGHMAKLNPVVQQLFLERERAAQHECNEVVAPMGADVARLVNHFAASKHAITPDVGTDIEIIAKGRQAEVTGCGSRKERAWFGIELAKAHEVAGERGGQDGKVALHITGSNARSRAGKCPPRDCHARFASGRGKRGTGTALHAEEGYGDPAFVIAMPNARSGGSPFLSSHGTGKNRRFVQPALFHLRQKNRATSATLVVDEDALS